MTGESRRTRISLSIAALVLSLVLSSCDIVGPDGGPVLGTIFYSGDATSEDIVIVPDTVLVFEDFDVRVYTYVGNCISGTSTTRVSIDGLRAEVTPIDHDSGDEVCTLVGLSPFLHEATLSFAEPGDAEVVLRARDFRTDEEIELVASVRVECPPGSEPWHAPSGSSGTEVEAGPRTPPSPPPCRPE